MSMTFEEFESSKQKGTFSLSARNELYGEISYEGPDTCLHLINVGMYGNFYAPEFPEIIKGNLFDSKKATLIKCIPMGRSIFGELSSTYDHIRFFPHYVLYGDTHVEPGENIFTMAQILVEDSKAIFYDFDAFGHLSDMGEIIDQVSKIQSERLKGEIVLSNQSELYYFNGNYEIFTTETVIGKISASHHLSINHAGPKGIGIDGNIVITINFQESINFDNTISYTMKLLRLIEILTGRRQKIESFKLGIQADTDYPCLLDMYCSGFNEKLPKKLESLGPGDILLEAVSHSDEFANVLTTWLERDIDWHIARQRFSNSFLKQEYSVDRLIGSANMFDILPSSAVPADSPICEELSSAVQSCKSLFKKLPGSPERDSILNALGRVGKSNLKQKIRHRVEIINEFVGENFPELIECIPVLQ